MIVLLAQAGRIGESRRCILVISAELTITEVQTFDRLHNARKAVANITQYAGLSNVCSLHVCRMFVVASWYRCRGSGFPVPLRPTAPPDQH